MEKSTFKERLLHAVSEWSSNTKSSFDCNFSRHSPEAFADTLDDEQHSVIKRVEGLWHKALGIVTANPSDKVRTQYLDATTKRGLIYEEIDRRINESKESQGDRLHVISAKRGSGKSTAQNLWINLNLRKYEDDGYFLVRCDVHKLQLFFNETKKLGITKHREFGVLDYISLQITYIILKYGNPSHDNPSVFCKKTLNDLIKSTSKKYKKHGFNVAHSHSLNQKEFISLLQGLIKEDEEYRHRQNDGSYKHMNRDDGWRNPIIQIALNAIKSPNKNSLLVQNRYIGTRELSREIFDHFKKNKSFRGVIVFLDGVDNMSWYSDEHHLDESSLKQSYRQVIDSIEEFTSRPSRQINVPTYVLLFCRPETRAHFKKNDSSISSAGGIYDLDGHVHLDEHILFHEIISLKIKQISERHDYLSKLQNDLESSTKTAKAKLEKEISSIEEENSHKNQVKIRLQALEKLDLLYNEVEWHTHTSLLLEQINKFDSILKNSLTPFLLKDLSDGNIRALTYNSIACLEEIAKNYPEIISSLRNKSGEYSKQSIVTVEFGGRCHKTKEFILHRDTDLSRQIRRRLVSFSGNLVVIEKDVDMRAALIPSFFKYSVSTLQESNASPVQKHRWGGLINLRILQLIEYSGELGITRKEVVQKISAYFGWPEELVSKNFSTLIEYGLIEPTIRAQERQGALMLGDKLLYRNTIKSEIVLRLTFNYPDIAMLMAIDAPMSSDLIKVVFKARTDHFKFFLRTMVIYYSALIRHIVIQKSIEDQNLPGQIKTSLESQRDQKKLEDSSSHIMTDKDIEASVKLLVGVFSIEVKSLIKDDALSGVEGALNELRCHREFKQEYRDTIENLKKLGIDLQ